MLRTNLARSLAVTCEEIMEAIDESFRKIISQPEEDESVSMDVEEIETENIVDVVSMLQLSDKWAHKKPYHLSDSVDVFVDFRSHSGELKSFRDDELDNQLIESSCNRFKTDAPQIHFNGETLKEWYYAYFYTYFTTPSSLLADDNPVNLGRESSKQLQVLVAEMLCRSLLACVEGKVTPSFQYLLFFIFKSDHLCCCIVNMLSVGLENLRSMNLSHAFMKSRAAHNRSVCVFAQARVGQ